MNGLAGRAEGTMMAEPRRCELPGCEAVIKPKPGRAGLRYCCNEHRLAAARARRKTGRRVSGDEPTIPMSLEPGTGCPGSADRAREAPYDLPSFEPGAAPWDIPPTRSRPGWMSGNRIARWAFAGALAVVVATVWVVERCAGDGEGEQPDRRGPGASPAASPVPGDLLTHHRLSVTFERATAGSAVADVDPADRARPVAPAA